MKSQIFPFNLWIIYARQTNPTKPQAGKKMNKENGITKIFVIRLLSPQGFSKPCVSRASEREIKTN
jgi:hypothetical protein